MEKIQLKTHFEVTESFPGSRTVNIKDLLTGTSMCLYDHEVVVLVGLLQSILKKFEPPCSNPPPPDMF